MKPTTDILNKFALGKLNAEELQQLEQLAKEDPFLADALDGLRSMESPAAFSPTVEQLQTEIDKKVGLSVSNPKLIKFAPYFAIAALFIVAVGAFVLFNPFKHHNQLAVQTELSEKSEEDMLKADKPTENILELDDSAVSSGFATLDDLEYETAISQTKEEIEIPVPSNHQDQNLQLIEPKTAVDRDEVLASDIELETEDFEEIQAPATPAAGLGKDLAVDDKVETLNDVAVSDEVAAEQPTRAVVASSSTETIIANKEIKKQKNISSIETAMSNYRTQNYKISNQQFEEVLAEDPANQQALYYNGLSLYNSNKLNKSVKNFNQIIDNNNSQYIDGAIWYKAQVLVRKRDYEEARELLRQLINNNSNYENAAREQLKTIE